MLVIEFGHSYSQVKNMTPEILRKLKAELSYKTDPMQAYYMGGFQRTRYLIDSKGFFPTGLLNRAMKVLTDNKILYQVKQKPTSYLIKRSISLNMENSLVPYTSQQEAVQNAIIAKRGVISMPTGTGKSLVIAMIIHYLKLKTLIIVPTLELKTQLTETLESMFGTLKYITVENIDSPKLQKASDYDCLIIDEAHHVAAKTYQKLNKNVWKDISYRFFLTATPFRNKHDENILFEGIAGQIIYKLDYKQAVKEGYIVPVEAYYVEIPKTPTEGYKWAQVYNELVVNNKIRNQIIETIIKNLKNVNLKGLCLVKEIAHGNSIQDLTGIPFINGQDEESRKYLKEFCQGDLQILIGTTGILGEGVDTKPAEYVIIAGLGKAKSSFMQQVGRAVRKYPGKESAKVIIFLDKSHKWTKAHFNAQCKILLEEYSVKPLKLEI